MCVSNRVCRCRRLPPHAQLAEASVAADTAEREAERKQENLRSVNARALEAKEAPTALHMTVTFSWLKEPFLM